MDEATLISKLRSIEALFAGATVTDRVVRQLLGEEGTNAQTTAGN